MKITIKKPSNELIGILLLLFLLVGLPLVVFQIQRQQEVRQRAQSVSCSGQSVCRWDRASGAKRYSATITDIGTNLTIKSEWVNEPVTELSFPSEPGKSYRCTVYAENDCGKGPASSKEITCP